MKRKRTGRALLCAVLALVLLTLAGCSLFNTGNITGNLPYEETFKELDTRYQVPEAGFETRVEVVTDESGEVVTDKVGEPVTNVVTIEPETEPKTEPETEPETELQNNYSPENLELLRQLYNQFISSSGDLLIAAWGTPNGALRQESVTGQNGEKITKFEEAIIALKNLGVNCLITSDEWKSDGALATTMSCAKNHSMSVWYNCSGQTAENAAEKLLSILTGTEANLLTGVLVGDRPVAEDRSNIAHFCDELRTALGTYRDQAKIAVNLRPYNTSFSAEETAYADYVKAFNAVQGVTATGVGIGMDFALFSYSPYSYSDSDELAGLIYNIDQVRWNGAYMPLYPVISVGQTADSREPTIEELRAQINICLALGAKGYILDNACGREGTNYNALVDKDGKTTSLYETAKAVYDELDGLREQYLLYTFSRMTLLNYEKANELLGGTHYTYTDSLVGGIMTKATEAQDRPVVIGNFYGAPSAVDSSKRSVHAYYIVNPDTTRSITVTCTLDDAYLQIIWGSEGCEKTDYANTFTIKLEPGEANFVVVNRLS